MTADEEIQRLLYTTLTGNGGIMALAAGVYDHVPTKPYGSKTAYISFGASDSNEDDADCISGREITQQIDIWSKAPGILECKNLTTLVRKAVHRQSLELAEHALVDSWVFLDRVIPNPGADHHGVVQVTFLVEEK